MTTEQKTYRDQRHAIHSAYAVSNNILWATYKTECTAGHHAIHAAAVKYNAQKKVDYDIYATALNALVKA